MKQHLVRAVGYLMKKGKLLEGSLHIKQWYEMQMHTMAEEWETELQTFIL